MGLEKREFNFGRQAINFVSLAISLRVWHRKGLRNSHLSNVKAARVSIEMHFLRGNSLLSFASRGGLRDLSPGDCRANFNSQMMHGSPVYHLRAPLVPCFICTMARIPLQPPSGLPSPTSPPLPPPLPSTTITSAFSTPVPPLQQRLFSFSFCPEVFRSSPRTPPLRSRTSATRIYGPSSATSSLKASWLSLLPSSLPAGYFTFAH